MNKVIRHWKQHYNSNADLILLKNLTFAGVEMKAGDTLSPEMRKTLGPYKLKLWWEAKMIAIADHVPAKPEVMDAAPVKQEEPKVERKPLAKKKKAKKLPKMVEPKVEPKLPEGDL